MSQVNLSPLMGLGVQLPKKMAASAYSILLANSVDVIESQWVPTYDDEVLYATRVWLDPLQDRLWFVDGNLSLKGGLYSVPIDCDSKTLGDVEKTSAV